MKSIYFQDQFLYEQPKAKLDFFLIWWDSRMMGKMYDEGFLIGRKCWMIFNVFFIRCVDGFFLYMLYVHN